MDIELPGSSVGFIAGAWKGVGGCCQGLSPGDLWRFQAPSGRSLGKRGSAVGQGGGEREPLVGDLDSDSSL